MNKRCRLLGWMDVVTQRVTSYADHLCHYWDMQLHLCFSTLLYLKFLIVWAMVILADFILEFRFEFLWPFWLLLRSVYDSFKYQGLVSIGFSQKYHDFTAIRVLLGRMRYYMLSVCFRPSLYFLFVLRSHQTWFAFSSFPCIGYSLLPALMFGCNTFGTQVYKDKYTQGRCKYLWLSKL